MIRINLLTIERKAVVKPDVVPSGSRWLVVGASLILLLCAGFIGWRYWVLTGDSSRLDAQLATAEQETAQLQSVIGQVQQFEQRKLQLQQRVTLIERLRSDQTGPVHMLDQISRALPSMVWLVELKQTEVANEVVIIGRCITPTGLPDFVGNLEASGYFRKSIEIVSSTTEPLPTPPGDLVNFEIKAIFQQPAGIAGAATPPAAKSDD
jgi:type IV pilus assembly protein PilN